MKDHKPGDPLLPNWEKYPPWVQYAPGVVGALWLVAFLGYIFWTMVLSISLSLLGKCLLTGICLGGIAFAISGILQLTGQKQIRPGDIGDSWSFARGAPPADPARYALWRKFRRTLVIFVVTAVLVVAWGIAVTLGLASASSVR